MKGRLRGALRRLLETPLGGTLGRRGYQAIARVEASRLLRLPGARAVYATGSLLSLDTLAPGHSDIDLVVIADVASPEAELSLTRALTDELGRLSRLGGLFNNLDLIAAHELPLVRAFGPAWAIELDRFGVCLAGTPEWTTKAVRPERELRLERFCRATRRFVNASGLLLNPRVRLAPDAALRLAGRLLGDVGFAWLGESRHQPLERLRDALEERGVAAPALELRDDAHPRERVVAHVALALTLLDRFSDELTTLLVGIWQDGGPAIELPERALFERFARGVVGRELPSCVPFRRAPFTDDWVPLFVLGQGASVERGLAAFTASLELHQAELGALPDAYRRPVLVTHGLMRTLVAFDPAPFAGAAAAVPSVVLGTPVPFPMAPVREDAAALVRARTVEAFLGLRAVGLRRGVKAEHVARELARKYGDLLPALRRAAQSSAIGPRPRTPEAIPRTDEEAARLRRNFVDEQIVALAGMARVRLGD